MKPAVVAEAKRDTSLAARLYGSFGITLGKREWLLAKDVLSGLCRSDHLTGMHGVRCAKHDGLNIRIFE